MDISANSGLGAQFAAALDWWRDAGVDQDWRDEPQAWAQASSAPADVLQPVAPSGGAKPAEPAAPEPAGPDRGSWPDSLDRFADWWRHDTWLDTAPPEARIAPRGPAGAEVMVLVPEPEQADRDTLLSGPQGQLLDAIIAAMGLPPDAVYRASVLPRATPYADWAALAARGLGELALHHVTLAAPRRLIIFGSHVLPLLGHDLANNPATFTEINHGGGTVSVLGARELGLLLERPRWKAEFWRSWLEWTRDAA